jgi:hypothetical protein
MEIDVSSVYKSGISLFSIVYKYIEIYFIDYLLFINNLYNIL